MSIEDSIKRLREALPKAPRGPYSAEYGNADSSAGGQWWAVLDDDTGTDLLHFPYNSTPEREAEAEAVATVFAACSPEVLAHLLAALDEREALREVPAGWKPVPVEPTDAMVKATGAVEPDMRQMVAADYRAMLAAAPPAPSVREVEPVAFDHAIGEGRFKVVKGSFWWHIRIGDSPTNVGKFHSKLAAEDVALKLLTAFRDGAFMQYGIMLAAAPPAPAQPAQGGEPSDLIQRMYDEAAQCDVFGITKPAALLREAAEALQHAANLQAMDEFAEVVTAGHLREREQLTHEQMTELVVASSGWQSPPSSFFQVARAVERAHGIGHPKLPILPQEEPAQGGGVVAGQWEGAEEWMPLAWALCADEHGEEACTELIWEGGAVPEPWGDRWLKYEGEAKRLIALVREHVPTPAPAAPDEPGAFDAWLEANRKRMHQAHYSDEDCMRAAWSAALAAQTDGRTE